MSETAAGPNRDDWFKLVRNVMDEVKTADYEFARNTMLDWINIAPEVYETSEKEATAIISRLLRQHFPVECARDAVFEGFATDFRHLSTVQTEKVAWLWDGRIPFGKITLLDGDPGLGKSTLTLDIAARMTTASMFPDGWRCPRPPTKVIVLSAEDGVADTIRPRLEAAGGDPSKILIVDAVWRSSGVKTPLDIENDMKHLASLIDETVSLVIIDPLMAFLPSTVNAYRDHEIRRSLLPLHDLAESTGIAAIMVRHLRKGSGGDIALYQGGGSIGITGAARSVLMVGRHPEDPMRRVLAPVKCNLARMPVSLSFEIVPDDNGVATIGWDAYPPTMNGTMITADDLVAAKRAKTKLYKGEK